MNGARALLPVVIVAAALVIRTAIGEIRRPGTVREQWTSATSGRAVAAGVVTAVAITVTGWQEAGPAALAWAMLTGALVALLMGRPPNRS
ncbi:hypothetical protein [Streptomyces sp. NBC_00286]|uniref:hypothetical protein n=1 Tax=Streptomyces sp. NBC_00286 TaxID=2975701 RepID=UPI002E28211D|nr:hypothetical protein [Streptomyces sp. NBC_00286]